MSSLVGSLYRKYRFLGPRRGDRLTQKRSFVLPDELRLIAIMMSALCPAKNDKQKHPGLRSVIKCITIGIPHELQDFSFVSKIVLKVF